MISGISNNNNLLKREHDSEENQYNKKVKTTINSENYPVNIDPETSIIVLTIALPILINNRLIDTKDLLSYESASKSTYKTTDSAWQALKIVKHANFDWKDCQQLSNKYKWSYILTLAVSNYYNTLEKTNANLQPSNIHVANRIELAFCELRKLGDKFSYLTKKFPHFETFIDDELSPYISGSFYDFHKNRLDSIEQASLEGFGGESLLIALLKSKTIKKLTHQQPTLEEKSKVIFAYDQAINQGCTIAAVYAQKLLHSLGVVDPEIEAWAIKTAQKTHFTALEMHLARLYRMEQIDGMISKHSLDKDNLFPPILYSLALKTSDLEKRNDLLTKALSQYKEQAPLEVIKFAADTSFLLNNLEKSVNLYMRILDQWPDKSNIELLKKIAEIKVRLNQIEEGDRFYMQVVKCCKQNDKIDYAVFFEAAKIKIYLKQYKEADELLSALNRGGSKSVKNRLPSLIAETAKVKLKINQFKSARDYFNKIKKYWPDTMDLEILSNFAITETYLKNFDKADQLFDKILDVYQDQLSLETLIKAAEVKFYFKKDEKAVALCTQAINVYNESIPLYDLVNIIHMEFENGKFLEMSEVCLKVVNQLNEAIIDTEILATAAKIQFDNKNFAAADKLYTQALNQYKNQEPLEILDNAIHTKFYLKSYSEAEGLILKLFSKYTDLSNISKSILITAAHTNFYLKNYQKAINFYTLAFQKDDKTTISTDQIYLDIQDFCIQSMELHQGNPPEDLLKIINSFKGVMEVLIDDDINMYLV